MHPGVILHPTAVVDEPCRIGSGTKIWHFCHVMADAVIGRDCVLGQNVFVASNVVIGDRVHIQNNVSVYAGVTLEADVFCGPSVVFTNVRSPRAEFPVHGAYESTRVGRGATLGANATIVSGCSVGRYALVGAGAVVTRDVPHYALMLGVPARRAGWVGRHGERLVRDGTRWRSPRSGSWYDEGEAGLSPIPDAREPAMPATSGPSRSS